ncbi:MAG: hypothetical protein KQH57_18470 [Actinomycetales bacterium]|nr:hypothetical protein [Actinomycetales bacterium]
MMTNTAVLGIGVVRPVAPTTPLQGTGLSIDGRTRSGFAGYPTPDSSV